jgi:integrase
MSLRVQHGSLLKKSGAYLGRFSKWLVDPDTGEKIRRQITFKIAQTDAITKAEARRVLAARIEQELGLRSDSRVTLQWFVEHRWIPLREGSWRDSTRATNLQLLNLILAKFGNVTLEDIDAVDLQQWINSIARTHSGSVVKHVRIFLKSIMAEAQDSEYIRRNPARALRIPRELKLVPKPYLSKEEIQRLLSVAKGMHKVLLKLLLCTGLRPSELFALEWRDFVPEQKLLHIVRSVYRGKLRQFTKTTDGASPRELQTVFLPTSLVAELEQWRAEQRPDHPENFIFSHGYDNLIHKENYQQRHLNPLAKAAGIERVNFQIVRRTVATLSQNLGSPKDIQTILRHKKPDTAQAHYVQAQEASVRATVEALAESLLHP